MKHLARLTRDSEFASFVVKTLLHSPFARYDGSRDSNGNLFVFFCMLVAKEAGRADGRQCRENRTAATEVLVHYPSGANAEEGQRLRGCDRILRQYHQQRDRRSLQERVHGYRWTKAVRAPTVPFLTRFQTDQTIAVLFFLESLVLDFPSLSCISQLNIGLDVKQNSKQSESPSFPILNLVQR